jgi:hypothetical protein
MGFGTGSFISRVYTNSFAGKNNEAYAPFRRAPFYGLSKPQYSHQIYYQLAYNGAGMGNRGDRWTRANGLPNPSFIPPN